MNDIPWSRWWKPFDRCRARITAWSARCDLRRGHKTVHLAERGMYWVHFYGDSYWTKAPGVKPMLVTEKAP